MCQGSKDLKVELKQVSSTRAIIKPTIEIVKDYTKIQNKFEEQPDIYADLESSSLLSVPLKIDKKSTQ